MRILLCSHVFAPSMGGIETVSAILADEWTRLGLSVMVVTETPGRPAPLPYEVIRHPALNKLGRLAANSDVVFQNNISLRTFAPLLASRKPFFVAHQTWLTRANGRRGWQDYLKLAALPLCRNIAISKAIAEALPVKSVVIGDPFEPSEFSSPGNGARDRDIVFLGRLVTDKGCHLVLRALAALKSEEITPSFSVIGDGPELPVLKRMTEELGLSDQVIFQGAIRDGRGAEVAPHKIMVIPSVWDEPFGVVALEGLAAGCILVASQGGGLPEAVGPCGVLFPNGNVEALALAIKELLLNQSLRESLRLQSGAHLASFRPEAVAKRYLDLFKSVLKS